MTYKLIGFRISRGTFTSKDTGEVIDYDNVVFQCVHQPIDSGYYGEQCSDIKIASRYLDIDKAENIDKLAAMIGEEVTFDFVPVGNKIRYVGIHCEAAQK